MRHLMKGRQLNRKPAHRRALMRSLATALFRHEAIVTTRPKAKEAQRFAERLITLAKRGLGGGSALSARRLVASRLQDQAVAKKVCEELAPRFADRRGGYTRVIKLTGVRKGDAAMRVRLELTEIRKVEEKKKKEKGKEKSKK